MPVMGPKGQIVISKEIRDRLGIGPGWLAIERVVDDHVEIHFVPPKHNRSLFGILRGKSDVTVSDAEWPEVRERVWAEVMAEKFGPASTPEHEESAPPRQPRRVAESDGPR